MMGVIIGDLGVLEMLQNESGRMPKLMSTNYLQNFISQALIYALGEVSEQNP